MKDFFELVIQYWLLIIFIGGIIWALIKQYFSFKYFKRDTVPVIFEKMEELQEHLDKHDKADEIMAKALTDLIDRNRQTTETTSKEVQGKLSTMGEDLAVIKNNINLILTGKIKEQK